MKENTFENYANIEPFEKHTERYEDWFERNRYAYLAELEAVKKLFGECTRTQRCLEVGVGTGRFAAPLGIKEGIDPSGKMGKVARKRGIKVKKGVAEKIPYGENIFDKVLMVTTICFVKDPVKSIDEIKRVLKPGGELIIGFVDKDSFLGKEYMAKKDKSLFYRPAKFFSAEEIKNMLEEAGFEEFEFVQTVFKHPHEMTPEDIEVRNGYGEGSFVVVKARKPMTQELSKVEVKGLEAKFYDFLMDVITLGKYRKFLSDALSNIDIAPGFKIAEFGAGTCRNLAIIVERARKENKSIEAIAFEIGEEMLENCSRRAKKYPEIRIIRRSILEPIPEELVNTQNAVLISFVLHGFTQQNREKIVKNARELLKENGKLYIIDYPPMDVEKAPFFAKFFLTKLECPLALDYIKRDRDAFLKKMGFEKAFEKMYFKGLISLSAFYKK